MPEKLMALERILHIMDDLRTGCPWDKKQTFESLRNLSIEEVYELVDAINRQQWDEVKKELGDVLLHIVFYAKLGDEQGHFDIADIANALADKLIYRHPHVYGRAEADTPEAVAQNWEQLKLREKGNRSVLQGIPAALPAMVKANRIQQKARGVGFDWTEREQVWDKVKEELAELQHEVQADDHDRIEAEFGDLFFSLINAARLYNINPEDALQRTNAKFIRRFNYLESKTIAQGRDLHSMSLDEMDAIWNEAKQHETKAQR